MSECTNLNYHPLSFSGHIRKKSVRDDFEESFTGLDDTHSEHSATLSRKVSETEISFAQVQAVESSMSQSNDEFLNGLDAPSNGQIEELTSQPNGQLEGQQLNGRGKANFLSFCYQWSTSNSKILAAVFLK